MKRPYESEPAMDAAAAPAAAISFLAADLQSKLSVAVTSSGAADDQFQAMLPVVKKRVDEARGAAVSSESWVVAHLELAVLEIQRSPSVEALADIDALYREQLERETGADQSGGTAILSEQRDSVQAQVDRQQAEIEAMKNRLR